MKNMAIFRLCVVGTALCVSYATIAQNEPLTRFESYCMSQGPYPNYINSVDWFPDDYEVQGVANDGQNWFFTIVDQPLIWNEGTTGLIWRIPKEVDLNDDVSGNAGVMSVQLDSLEHPDLWELNAWHWGDLDHFVYSGEDYLIVPITQDAVAIFAIFKADDLSYVNFGYFTSSVSGGWCAVGKDLNLYASANNPDAIVRYFVDWEGLLFDGVHDTVQEVQEYQLYESNGTTPLELTDMQGGEFTSSGELLYLVSGRGECAGGGAPWTPYDGIHVIRTDTWTQIQQSKKTTLSTEHFAYMYDPTCVDCDIFGIPTGWGSDTPEGLTIWNLDDGSAPGIRGSLHVLVDRYMPLEIVSCDDELSFHHFSSKVYVDIDAVPGVNRFGTLTNQFTSVMDAHDYYPIWDGAVMSISEGVYDDTGLLNQRIKLQSRNGTVLIGQQ
jgi:hypothetical protein